MLSKNGKEEYVCCHCHNPDIQKIKMYGQNSFECRSCNRWYAWSNRKIIKAGNKLMLREDYMFIVGICVGLLLAGIIALFIFNFTETKYQLFKWLGAVIIVGVAGVGTWVNLKFRGII